MSIHRILAATAIALCIEPHAVSSQDVVDSEEHVRRIVGEAIAGGGAYRFLHLLTDSIGGRITGTPESRRAANLLLTTLRQYGFDDAHFEEYSLASP